MTKLTFLGAGMAIVVASNADASAFFRTIRTVSYTQTVSDFGGAVETVHITDAYWTSPDPDDVLLNIFNVDLGSGAPTSYYQSATGAGWLPNNLGSIFDTQALQEADSFVTIGGFDADVLQTVGAGAGSGLDPNFGGNSAAAPGNLAGWFNSSPPNLNGRVQAQAALGGEFGALIGRFSSLDEAPDIFVGSLGARAEFTWNQGLGTPAQQGEFPVPAPGVFALMGLAGLAIRRRRH